MDFNYARRSDLHASRLVGLVIKNPQLPMNKRIELNRPLAVANWLLPKGILASRSIGIL